MTVRLEGRRALPVTDKGSTAVDHCQRRCGWAVGLAAGSPWTGQVGDSLRRNLAPAVDHCQRRRGRAATQKKPFERSVGGRRGASRAASHSRAGWNGLSDLRRNRA